MLRKLLVFPLAAALAAVCVAPAAEAAAPPPAPLRRIAVMPLRNLGVDDDVAASLLGFLRAEVGKLPTIRLLELGKVETQLSPDCSADPKCLAAAAQKVNADEVVFGTVAGLGDAYSIDLKRVVAKGWHDERRVTETLSGERELLIDGIRAAAYKLLLPERFVGAVQVDLKEKGAEVFVDGRSVGVAPLKAPIQNLVPGKHALKIVMRGFADFDKWVDVKFARVSVVKVDLRSSTITGVMYEKDAAAAMPEPEPLVPPPPAEPWWPPFGMEGQRLAGALTASGGVLLVAAGGIVGLMANADAAAIDKFDHDPAVSPADADQVRPLVQSHRTKAITADILFAAGGVAVVTGAVLWFTADDDWSLAAAPAPGGMTVGYSTRF